MYFEFLFLRAHSRKRVERMYWSGRSLYSFTTCSKEVTVGTTGPIGSGLPQFGFPRRFAIGCVFLCFEINLRRSNPGAYDRSHRRPGSLWTQPPPLFILGLWHPKSNNFQLSADPMS